MVAPRRQSTMGGGKADPPHPRSLGFGFLLEPIGQHRWVGDAEQIALAAHGREVAGSQVVGESSRCDDAEEAFESDACLGLD